MPFDTREITSLGRTNENSAPAPDTPAASREAAHIDQVGTDTDDKATVLDSIIDRRRRASWSRVITYVVLPVLALTLALGAGYLKWLDNSARDSQTAASQSVRAATESTIALLSYKPDTVERDLTAARGRLTGSFKDSYGSLIHDVVIPGATEKQITSVADVAAAASMSATEKHAEVLAFVNQTITIGGDAPTNTKSSVRVTLDKVDGQWRISQFDPV